jgi:hypothetical protein
MTCWGASIDGGNQFWGFFLTGSSTTRSPPTTVGWRDFAFDFKNVPTLGNILGQPEVWFAWNFRSDAELIDDGPFIDDVLIEKRVGPLPSATRTALPASAAATAQKGRISRRRFDWRARREYTGCSASPRVLCAMAR